MHTLFTSKYNKNTDVKFVLTCPTLFNASIKEVSACVISLSTAIKITQVYYPALQSMYS